MQSGLSFAQWQSACETLEPTATVNQVWPLFEQGLAFIGEHPPPAEIGNQAQHHLSILTIQHLLPAAHHDVAPFLNALDRVLQELEQRYQQLAESRPAIQDLFGLRAQVNVLEPLVYTLDNRPWHPLTALLAHIDELAFQCRDASPATHEQIVALRLKTLRQQGRHLIASLRQAPAGQSPDSIKGTWAFYHEGLDLLLDLHRYGTAQASSVQMDTELETLSAALREALTQTAQQLAQLIPEQRQRWLEQTASEISDQVAEVLSKSEDWPRPTAVFARRTLRDDLDALLASIAEQGLSVPKRLRRLRRNLHVGWVEQTVMQRLEARYSPRSIRRLDRFVLVAILGVLALLVIEWTTPLSQTWRWSLAWIDTIICGVFVLDFGLRIQAAPDRPNYFRRHWLTDLLPAIPFGIISLGLDSLATAQHTSAIRALRLPALIARNSRPLVRVLRIVLFLVRGLDRMVRHYSWLLNRDIVFFSPSPPRDMRSELLHRLDVLGHRLRQDMHEFTTQNDDETIWTTDLAYSEQRLALLTQWNHHLPDQHRWSSGVTQAGHNRAIRVEEVINALTNTDQEAIEVNLGAEFPRQVANLSRVASLPPLRWLPVFGEAAKARHQAQDLLEQATQFARNLGRRLQALNDYLLMLADLHGIITPTQMVDRVGGMMVSAMRRHAKRFLILGVLFTVFTLLVEIIQVSWLEATSSWLREHLGLPIILIGVIAFLFVQLGNWLQRIASTANAFSIRAAEAQFLPLLNQIKEERRDRDHSELQQRILAPEIRIGGTTPPAEPTATDFATAAKRSFAHHQASAFGLADRLILLYQDYLDGAPLHASSRTSTRQLLSNFTLQDLMQRVMRLSKREQKQLQRLRLDQTEGISGPGLWFNFITQALAQRVGALVEDYNRNVLPLTEQATLPPEHPRQQFFKRWLQRKQGNTPEAAAVPDPNTGYATTAFTALDFITLNAERQANLAEQFGPDVIQHLQPDRKRLIREVFGTLPYYNRPPSERSLNLYRLYWRFLGNGRLFLLPFTLLALAAIGIAKLLGWFYRMVRQLLEPEFQPQALREDEFAEFAVALRKLLRMRKPVLLAACRLRARVDIEYLGLALPGAAACTVRDHHLYADLSLVKASLSERDPFYILEAQQTLARDRLARYLESRELLDEQLQTYLRQQHPHLSEYPLRALRALTMAHAVNYDDLNDRIEASLELPECVASLGQLAATRSLAQRLLHEPFNALALRAKHALARRLWPAYRRDWTAFERWWSKTHAIWSGRLQIEPDLLYHRLKRGWRRNHPDFRRLVRIASKVPAGNLDGAIEATFAAVLASENTWSEQLVTLRTIQTLTTLDLVLEKELVWALGEYTERE